MKLLLRLISVLLAALFAAKGGFWWIGAVAHVFMALAPVKAKGFPMAYKGALVICLLFAIAFAAYALISKEWSPILGLYSINALVQALQERQAILARKGAAPAAAPPGA